MSTNDPSNPPQDPRTIVKWGEQLWSANVAMAEMAGQRGAACEQEIAYEFSNGRRFIGKRDPYAPLEPRG
jgi:hypothetical protein